MFVLYHYNMTIFLRKKNNMSIFYYLVFFLEMLTDAFKVLINNSFKKNFYVKRKKK